VASRLCEDSLEYGATIRGLAQGECVTADLASADRAALEKIVRQLEAAWNAMDGSAFAAPFAAEADFVNIRGDHFRGRAAIAAGHAAICLRMLSAPAGAAFVSPPAQVVAAARRECHQVRRADETH
jgi:hypothetical protein